MQNDVNERNYILNPVIYDKRSKYIWFDRDEMFREGILECLKIFLYYEIYIDGFATGNMQDVGLKIFNKEIVDINGLEEKNSIVFLNVEYENVQYKICKPLKISNVMEKAYQLDNIVRLPMEIGGFQLQTGTFIRVYRIVEMLSLMKGKKIFIYGYGKRARRFSRYLKLLDFQFVGFFCDYEEVCDELIVGDQVDCIENVLYEDHAFVIIENQNPEKALRKLESMGYQYGIDFVFAEPFAAHFLFVRKNALDINLGNTYVGASKYEGVQINNRQILEKYPGFCIYGTEQENNYKIAILGGSTTDGNMFPFKSWSELLYEKIHSDKVTIYNGGVSGYTSGQELLKFVRDILPMKPDMVLVFDGFNDTCQENSAHPYSFSYAREIYDYGSRNMEDEYVAQQIGTGLCEGINIKQTRFENWRNNMELIHTVAISKGIKFFSFLQPMLRSKNRSKKEDEIFLSSRQFYEKDLYVVEDFRDQIKNEENPKYNEYIYDLSDIFDETTDVYMDICHVNEKGNKIIADSIFNIVEKELFK